MPNILGPLEGPLSGLLQALTGTLHNYGIAIIIFTLLVRGVLSPLNLRQLHSARKMAALAPRLKDIQQRYKGNREELAKQQMTLYKEEGVNPAAGCLPLIIQMPILYSMFFIFRSLADKGTPAIYHAHFLWFQLDKADSLFGHFFLGNNTFWGPLPLLAALTQWIQSRMMMQPTSDPNQRTTQQIMQIMPLIVIVFAVNYPAGLALYWVTSTLFSIVLQYTVTGWGQLFTSPLSIPDAPAAVAEPRRLTARERSDVAPEPRRAKRTVGAPRDRAVLALTPGDDTPPAVSNGHAPDAVPDLHLGKMQRAVTRSRPRSRSSRGAKR